MVKVRSKPLLLLFIYIFFVIGITQFLYFVALETSSASTGYPLILSADGYADANISGIWNKLIFRVRTQPFNLIALIIFFCAIVHTFMSHKFAELSHRLIDRNAKITGIRKETFGSEILHFMSEVEVIFGIWVIPLLLAMSMYYDWSTAIYYLNGRDYTEPVFVIVIMALAATKPVFKVAEDSLKAIAWIGGGTVKSWWFCVLTVGPLLGSFITEPGAMTICALLLGKQFYRLKPTLKLAYATLGLLFVNISVGGIFTNFAAPPVLMVSKAWHWDSSYMMSHFGWKAVIGIVLANALYFFLFRRELEQLNKKKIYAEAAFSEDAEEKETIPFWISLVHLFFLAWTVVHSHYPVIFLGTFLLFLGFYRATLPYQTHLNLKTPVLVGFFLAGLVVHGGLQAWWISPILSEASNWVLMVTSVVLTAFNDNAEITYLATLVPAFNESMKYAVVAGAVTGGGLTVIANAPNPAGQAILGKHFPDGIAPLYLFLAALVPTIIIGCCLYFIQVF